MYQSAVAVPSSSRRSSIPTLPLNGRAAVGWPFPFGSGPAGGVVVEMSPYPATPMPVVHITLECAMPTAHTDGRFRTLVFVTDAELRDGDHVREAIRRASIIGFGGPHRVCAAKRLDAVAFEVCTESDPPDEGRSASSLCERLEPLLTAATAVEGDVPDSDAFSQRGATRRPPVSRPGKRGDPSRPRSRA